jgi:crotonobetainyl-CoA:carnitine CoA-transferase CaiB-like acyl-CoA transferase
LELSNIPEKVKTMERKPAPLFSPEFGPLKGVRVLLTGSIVAGPFIATMLGDLGAEVIHIEPPGSGDTYRTLGPFLVKDGKKVSLPFSNDARNRLSMTLDLRINKNPESREIFLGLIKQSDIWVENLVWLEERYGITDDLVMKVNPRIVIVHVSGYGHPNFGGDPKICKRASYDLIGQAYSGWPNVTGFRDGPPTRLSLWACDYVTALFGTIGALAGYLHAQKTGEGQVIDVAQYEAVARMLESYYTAYLNAKIEREREGNKATGFQPYGIFKASNGWVAIGAFGPAVYKRFLEAMKEAVGLDPNEYPWEECAATSQAVSSPKGRKLDSILTEYVEKHTVEEIEELFNKYSVPCSRVMTPKDAANDAHWLSRQLFVEAFDYNAMETLKFFGVVPKFNKTPGKVWRGSPKLGQDSDEILKKLLGYTDEEIKRLREKKIV